jgi:hypothetical protein
MAERQTAKGRSPEPGAHRHGTQRGLEVCPACDSRLVYPVDWEPADPRRWRVGLRCPDCEWQGGGVFSQDTVDAFDEALDLGTEALLEELTLLTRANLEEEVERFVAALHAGHILPEDF